MTPSDQGFTLAETLMALIVVSLALAAILAATNIVTRANRHAAQHLAMSRSVDSVVQRILVSVAMKGPYGPEDLTGSGSHIAYDCGKPARCDFSLGDTRLHLSYVSDGRMTRQWPPGGITSELPPRLEALLLQDKSDKTMGVVQLETEQPATCQFDMISRTCRSIDRSGSSEGGSR